MSQFVFFLNQLPHRSRGVACILTLSVMLIALTGCGDGRPTRVPVSGTVLIDGKPLTHGRVRFIPTGARMSEGTIDENGRFVLGCFEKDDGAVVGEHRVVVDGSQSINNYTTRWHAPKKYTEPNQSGLQQVITEPTDSVIIELSWNGGAPFNEVDESAKEEKKGRRNLK